MADRGMPPSLMGGRREIKYLPRTNRQKSNPSGGSGNPFPMSAISVSSVNATAYGAADASCSAVRGHVEKSATRTVNILQLNINGTQKKLPELSSILYSQNVHVACLQETKLNPKLNLKIKGYTAIRRDRLTNPGGGVAFLIKTPEVKFTEIAQTTPASVDSNTEAQAINILLPKLTITIVNAYHPDDSPINTNLLQSLADTTAEAKIILGDLNAKSPSWGCTVLNSKGSQLDDLTDDLNLTVLNTGENTYVSRTNGTASALDITAISQNFADKSHWQVLKSAISDHYPILTTIKTNLECVPQQKRSWNFRRAHWEDFEHEMEHLCSASPESEDLEKLLTAFTRNIQIAAKHHIPRGKRRANWIPFWRDHNIEKLINERDSISQELMRNNSDELRNKLIAASNRVEKEISTCKQEKWTELCSRLDPRNGTSQYWNLLKVLNNSKNCTQEQVRTNVLTARNVDARTNRETANMLAKHYENASKLSYNSEDRKLLKTSKSIIKLNKHTSDSSIFTSDLTLEELESAIQRLDPRKSPGPDLIYGHMLHHLGQSAKSLLLRIFNISWQTGKLPKIWKNSTIIPILKPGKEASNCKSYRPISLTSILCKTMERIIHTRLMKWLIEEKKLQFYQTAYRVKHSTVDQLFYLCQSIIDGFQEKPSRKTTVVFLDLSAAFDKVWRQKLIDIIHKEGIVANCLIWINDFLRGRKFRVKVNGSFSKSYRTWAGVPQGSVLSPLLFLLYMNTLDSHICKEAKVACYADDVAVWHTHSDIQLSQKILNQCMEGIEKWSRELKLTVNPDKTNFCIFSTDRKNRKNLNPTINLLGSVITRTKCPTYLGLTLDDELRFSQHLEQISNKASKRLNILKSLCGASWGSRPATLLNAYTSFVRPILEYAAPIWAPASSSSKNKVDNVQYRASKIIIGAVSSTNNIKAESECGLTSLESRRKLATIKFTNKIRSLTDLHVSNKTFKAWNGKTRLKRSSTLQFDKEIRMEIDLQHENLTYVQEPVFHNSPSPMTTINLSLLQPCTKKEPAAEIKEKGLRTIRELSNSAQNLTIAYTDGSSDSNLDRGGAGILFTYVNGKSESHKISVGKIASNYTCELVAIREALNIYCSKEIQNSNGLLLFSDSRSALQAILSGNSTLTQDIIQLLNKITTAQRTCILQWIPAHVDIDGNEEADILAKEARDDPQLPNSMTLSDADAIASRRLLQASAKHSIPALNCDRAISTTIARLRTKHLKGMKIFPDGHRSYRSCPHCKNTELSPNHLFDCPAIVAKLLKIHIVPPHQLLYSMEVIDVARAVLDTFGPI